jgi:methylphosphotriester-DNA--protein-cysteine methyltransferase
MYRVVSAGELVETDVPAPLAGIVTTLIFGRLDCPSGWRAKRENRVFFASWGDAIAAGHRPCRRCRPTPGGV